MAEMMDPAARAAATARAAELSSHFDMERVTDGYVALYDELARIGGEAPPQRFPAGAGAVSGRIDTGEMRP